MKPIAEIAAFALLFSITVLGKAAAQTLASSDVTPLAHTRTEFTFTVDAPFEQVMPLFGAHEERKWAQDWNPQFIYPNPARDQQGEVFTVQHGGRSAIWINTVLDLTSGHVQYTYVLNDAMATLIDIHATRESEHRTQVSVVYERTALIPEANEHVQHFARGDQKSGKEWSDAINAYFAKTQPHGSADSK